MYNGYSDDVTWCSNEGCKAIKCERNPNDSPDIDFDEFIDLNVARRYK